MVFLNIFVKITCITIPTFLRNLNQQTFGRCQHMAGMLHANLSDVLTDGQTGLLLK